MKILLLFLLTNISYAATCTSISRTNYSANQVLTSSSLNDQFNTAYTFLNAWDFGCGTAGTLESDSLNATDFATPLRAIQHGCKVSYTDSNTVSISKCYAAVNGAWVAKSTATSLAFGCGGCASDSASTVYYAYISTGSTGSTLNAVISTTAPNDDGYDNSGNKVLARFYNNASSAIDTLSIDQWHINRFIPTNTTNTSYTPTSSWVANTTPTGTYRREGAFMRLQLKAELTGAPTSASLTFDLPSGYLIDSARLNAASSIYVLGSGSCSDVSGGGLVFPCFPVYSDTNTIQVITMEASASYVQNVSVTQAVPVTFATGDSVVVTVSVPIVGWND